MYVLGLRAAAFVLLVLCVTASCSCGAWGGTLFSDDFEDSAVGSIPYLWRLNSTNSTTSAAVANGYAGNTTHVAGIHDTNTNTENNHLKATFEQRTCGTTTVQFDACLASIHAGIGIRITNGGTVTSGGNWGAAIKFEGDVPYAPGAEAGTISYQEYTSGENAYTPTSPVVRYSANTWYTVKIAANIDTKKYDIYFGPRGGTLSRITPSGGVPFIKTATGGQISSTGGMSFFTSQKVEGAGDLYIDNVIVTSTVEMPSTISQAKLLANGSAVALQNRVASAGTDQMTGPFFYVQDETGGIRVRSSTAVRQGDMVSVYGTLRRAADNGTATLRNGEREINAISVSVTYGPYPMPKPVGLVNRVLGGAPFGPIDTDGYPCQPGVWAKSTGATSGYDQISEIGLNNIGRLCRLWGRVVYADDAHRFFYVDDGSGVHDGSVLADGTTPSPSGIRVLVPPGTPLVGIVGKFAVVTGISGSVAQSEAGSPKGPTGNYIRNIRVLRAACEPFVDFNLNGYWDPGETFLDTNASGGYDGIVISGVPSPNLKSGFDRYGTAIVNGRPFLIKGIYCYDVSGSTLDAMVAQGFNTVIDFDVLTPADLPAYNARGLKTMPCLRNPAQRPAWMAVKNDPAIIGWYTHDEPEGQGVSPEQAYADYLWVKAQDPYHFAGESHFLLNAFNDYKASDEFAISDCYPVTYPTASIIPIANILAYTKSYHGSVYYPAYQFVQLFGGAPQVLPTPAQVRAMTYLALAFHARGILYFSYQRLNDDWWQDWAEVKKLNAEMDMFRGFLTLPWYPLDCTTSTEEVRIGGIRVGNSALIITVNVNSWPATATFTLPGIPASSLSLPIEGGTQPLTNRSFTYTYQPYQVRVLVWGDIPAPP